MFLTRKLHYSNLNRYQEHTTLFHEFIQQSTNKYHALTLCRAPGIQRRARQMGFVHLSSSQQSGAERDSLYTPTQLKLILEQLPKSDAKTINFYHSIFKIF